MYIPKIEEIKAIGNDVMTDLLISDHVFIKCENFQSSFKSYIIDKVIKEIDRAVLDFFISLKERSPSVMETALFRILYPFEVSSEKMKESSLGIGFIIDDDFSKIIEDSFDAIYN